MARLRTHNRRKKRQTRNRAVDWPQDYCSPRCIAWHRFKYGNIWRAKTRQDFKDLNL